MTEKTQQILIISILIIAVIYLIVSNNGIFTNSGKYNEQGFQLNVDKAHFQQQEIKEYHENAISIDKVEGGVNSGSGTINNAHVTVGERK